MKPRPIIDIYVRRYNFIYRKVVSEYWGTTVWHRKCKSAAESVRLNVPGPAGIVARANDKIYARFRSTQ